jgi:hypothetical protein
MSRHPAACTPLGENCRECPLRARQINTNRLLLLSFSVTLSLRDARVRDIRDSRVDHRPVNRAADRRDRDGHHRSMADRGNAFGIPANWVLLLCPPDAGTARVQYHSSFNGLRRGFQHHD